MNTLFWGKIRHGDKRGRVLGYPTANMAIHKKIDEGVYISLVKIHKIVISSTSEKSHFKNNLLLKRDPSISLHSTQDDKENWHPALTFIGKATTFGKTDYKAETWVIDFQDNLYDRFLTIKLLKKARKNKKFDSAESLIEQMKQDEKEAREFFSL